MRANKIYATISFQYNELSKCDLHFRIFHFTPNGYHLILILEACKIWVDETLSVLCTKFFPSVLTDRAGS